MSYFIRNGNTFNVSDSNSLDIHEKLPAGNYIIKQNPMTGALYLEMIDGFTPLKKLYGDTTKNAGRIINTFRERTVSTGVMLAGEKGSGKSLLAKTLSIECAALDIPTIVINTPWKGDAFNKFLQDISQPCMVLFDEFEKVYDRDDQEEILTLLDGVFPSKKLFVLTCNDKFRVDSHMRNRPGRIYYMLNFKGLGADFITEYCQDNLQNKQFINKICEIAALFREFNFDMLKALVEEMNRYGETPQEALRMLNASPEFDGGSKFDVKLFRGDKEVPDDRIHGKEWNGNPLSPEDDISINFYDDKGSDDRDDWEWECVEFNQSNLLKVDAQAGTFLFGDGEYKLLMKRVQPKYFDYGAF
jgi:hypothetical protein